MRFKNKLNQMNIIFIKINYMQEYIIRRIIIFIRHNIF